MVISLQISYTSHCSYFFSFIRIQSCLPGTKIVFSTTPKFPRRSSSLLIFTNAINGTSVESSFNSNFAFTFDYNPRSSEKKSGEFELSSLFTFSVFADDPSTLLENVFIGTLNKSNEYVLSVPKRFYDECVFCLSLRKEHL